MAQTDVTYGYKDLTGTGLSNEILASDQYQMISITIATAARDPGNSPTTDLRRGLVLRYDSTTGKYLQLTLAAESPTAVILAEEVPSIDNGDVVVKAFYKATFKSGTLLDDSGNFDLELCQRISERDNV
jgi:hypothetical protein